jgi:RNA polymerase sigma-70 factor (ECF subfamily)
MGLTNRGDPDTKRPDENRASRRGAILNSHTPDVDEPLGAPEGADIDAFAASGEPEAFASPPPPNAPRDFRRVYLEHFDFAYRSLRLLGVARNGLEDAVQDVFGIVSRRLVEFAGNSSLKTWIFSIVQRVAANHRRRHRRKQSPLVPLTEAVAGSEASPEAHAEAAQSAVLIQTFCDRLEEGRRALFVLALIEGVPPRELADSLGIPLFTVYSRIRTLREALELFLRRHEDEHD